LKSQKSETKICYKSHADISHTGYVYKLTWWMS